MSNYSSFGVIVRPFLHTVNFYQGIIRSNLSSDIFVSLHRYVFLLFFHHRAYHSEWLSWPCLCNFFTIISITLSNCCLRNQLRQPKFHCIIYDSKCNLYLFDSFFRVYLHTRIYFNISIVGLIEILTVRVLK